MRQSSKNIISFAKQERLIVLLASDMLLIVKTQDIHAERISYAHGKVVNHKIIFQMNRNSAIQNLDHRLRICFVGD